MTDPIADFLTRIRNAIVARKAKIEVPASKIKAKLAEILEREGYIAGFALSEQGPQGQIVVNLRYDAQHRAAIEGLRRVSRPGQRMYVAKDGIPKVRSGLGVAILTTSKGIMTDREARKQGVGGEVICEIW
ncbi:MAG TPA: 30S ribosomal protein S8 [Polyangia bacterium]|nr:30S ribosomal protein S8 [Polyangia bacterium]